MLQNLYQAMFRRGTQERITHAVVFDEAHRAMRLKLIPTMAKECRKHGLSLIVASQEVKDFDDSMFTAIASYHALRTSEADARETLKNLVSLSSYRTGDSTGDDVTLCGQLEGACFLLTLLQRLYR